MKRGKIAIPVWMGRISPVFDTAAKLWIVQSRSGRGPAGTELTIEGLSAAGRVQQLRDSRIDVLICAGISEPLMNMISAAGIRVVRFISGEVTEVLAAYLNRELADQRFLMPGRQGRGRGRRTRGGGRGRGGRGQQV